MGIGEEEGIYVHSTRPQWMPRGSELAPSCSWRCQGYMHFNWRKEKSLRACCPPGKVLSTLHMLSQSCLTSTWHEHYYFHLREVSPLKLRGDNQSAPMMGPPLYPVLPDPKAYKPSSWPMAEVRGLTLREEMVKREQGRDTQAFWVITPQFFI